MYGLRLVRIIKIKKCMILLMLLSCIMFSVTLFQRQTVARTLYVVENKPMRRHNVVPSVQTWIHPTELCVRPHLELWNPTIEKQFVKAKPLECSSLEENWVSVSNGNARITERAVQKHGGIRCDYIPFIRPKSDFAVDEGTPVQNISDDVSLMSDWFEVSCEGQDHKKYNNVHSAIAYNAEVHGRQVNLLPKSLGLNILMFGFDSVSRLNWIRNLPKSHRYLVDVLEGVVLEGYNIVGDGTPQALLPILTGKTELELPDSIRGHPKATTVDDYPWIWRELEKLGYVTQWGEDGAQFGTFTYRMLGFKDQPVDHYLRPFYLRAGRTRNHKPYCVGSTPRHVNMMNWIKDFYQMYPNHPKFSFVFHSEYSHGAFSQLQVADDDLVHFLQYMEESGHLNNTLLIVMADHGARFQKLRHTVQGKYEERLPYMALRLPPWFRAKFPSIDINLRANRHKLTTPFDLHPTFFDVISYTEKEDNSTHRSRGMSLFKDIPNDRSCDDADIEAHWCSCLNWQDIATSDPRAQKAADEVLSLINNQVANYSECHLLSIANITKAVKMETSADLLKFKKSKDPRGFVPDLSDKMKAVEDFFQITMSTLPGFAEFEATVRYIIKEEKFVASIKQLSRINKYGLQPHCVMDQYPHLRPYCYCNVQVTR